MNIRKIAVLALLYSASALAYAPDPPPSPAQRSQIDQLARAYTGKKCSGVPHDYLWGVFAVKPFPAAQIPQQQAEHLAQVQQVAEGWSGKVLSSTLKNYGSFVRIHNLVRYSNGAEAETRYELLTFHVTAGKVTRQVYAECVIR